MAIFEYDIRGQICPSTLLFALREINNYADEISDGKVSIHIKTDNRDCLTTIPESAGNMGYQVAVTKEEAYYLIKISGNE